LGTTFDKFAELQNRHWVHLGRNKARTRTGTTGSQKHCFWTAAGARRVRTPDATAVAVHTALGTTFDKFAELQNRHCRDAYRDYYLDRSGDAQLQLRSLSR